MKLSLSGGGVMMIDIFPYTVDFFKGREPHLMMFSLYVNDLQKIQEVVMQIIMFTVDMAIFSETKEGL